jgi:hypothetical protein
MDKVFDDFQTKHFTIFAESFGLMVNTITVVGYGTFLPEYRNGIQDILLIMIAIYIGTVMFSKFAGPLNQIFSNSLRLITIEKRIMTMEDNFWIFVIDNNRDKNKKAIEHIEMNHYAKSIVI